MTRFLGYLFPRQVTITHKERLLSGLAGLAAVAVTIWLSQHLVGEQVFPFLLASMGASTVLLFGAPHSPLSQPWSFVGGHLISGLIGITCAHLIPDVTFAGGLAVGLAIVAMYYLRCLHPPGGATALLAVIGDQRIHALGYHLLVMPVLINIVVLLLAALLINRLVPGRRYPVSLSLPGKTDAVAGRHSPPVKLGFSEEDLVAALRDMNAYIDVTGEDLEQIYSLAMLHSHRRQLGDIRLKDLMTRKVVTISPQASLESLWALLRRHGIRGVPVVADDGRVVGVVTVVDFMKMASWRMCVGLIEKLKSMLRRSSAPVVERIMTSPAITARADMGMAEAFLLFAQRGINHLPVVDGEGRAIGIVTRLDLLSALYGDLAMPMAA